ncbi:MAG: fructosamine kinase family protein [Marivibrio sp.]|uniref:fructosamine kinase family protein n=1 Tax=Marivibrio sp. TaxID=2039719 RepID=UPI0032EAE6F7
MTGDLAARIERALGAPPASLPRRIGGGATGSVFAFETAQGARLAVKQAAAREAQLDLEGWMLRLLAERSALPVPAVHYAAPELLIMDFVETGGPIDARAEEHAADLIAALHGVRGEVFGLERDTLIGPLIQPNRPRARWLDFYAEERLLPFARAALDAGGIGAQTMDRAERLAGRIGDFLAEPDHPSLIHGDLWGGNVLARAGRIAGFIDPAVHYAHPEVELAFTTLFGTFGERFFARYQERRPIEPGFFKERRDLYLMYPLLVHATLFGAGYGRQADAILRRAVG